MSFGALTGVIFAGRYLFIDAAAVRRWVEEENWWLGMLSVAQAYVSLLQTVRQASAVECRRSVLLAVALLWYFRLGAI